MEFSVEQRSLANHKYHIEVSQRILVRRQGNKVPYHRQKALRLSIRSSRVVGQTGRPDDIGQQSLFKSHDGSVVSKSQDDRSFVATHKVTHQAEQEEAARGLLNVSSWWQKRWTMVALCFVAFMLCNMDRVNMSIAVIPMKEMFNWDIRTVGLVQSSFFWGYLTTQILGGVIADKLGGKLILGIGVIWWSVATALTPVAASFGLPALLFTRACMGIGEGVAMPAMNNLLSKWVPVKERSRSLALVYSGMHAGSIVGLALSPQLIKLLHLNSVFYIFGVLGVLWFAAWQVIGSDSPSADATISQEEKTMILNNTSAQSNVQNIPWGKLLRRKEVWAIIISHFCHNWGLFILLTWMPSYYNQVLHLDLASSGVLSVLPWLTMALCGNLGGYIADKLVDRGVSVTTVRKLMQTIGFLGPAFFLTQLCNITTATTAVLCMMASQGLDSFSHSGLYCNHQDIAPRYSGVLLGMSNTAGVLAGVLGTGATGYILQQYSWTEVWMVAVALYVIGTVVWLTMSTGEKIID